MAKPILEASGWAAWLLPLRQTWWNDVSRRRLAWYAEHKLDEGAAAAFLGLTIKPNETWEAVAIGDSCIFQMRQQQLRLAFPVQSSNDFNNHPRLAGARPSPREPPLGHIQGNWEAGDQFLLMTDALAKWFLKELEDECDPLVTVRRILDSADNAARLAAEIDGLRDAHKLRNDDVALALINV